MSNILKSNLQQTVSMWETMNYPALAQRFVIRNGVERLGTAYAGKRMTPKECFGNAAKLAIRSPEILTYEEGFAMGLDIGFAFQHAWCVDGTGKVFDPTLENPENYLFMGVSFPFDVLTHELGRNKYYGLLTPGEMANTELMFARDPELKTIVDKMMGRETVTGDMVFMDAEMGDFA